MVTKYVDSVDAIACFLVIQSMTCDHVGLFDGV
jgi:hypothetical protein